MGEMPSVGIQDKNKYYELGSRAENIRITTRDSIRFDLELIENRKAQGLITKNLRTFLLGGCFSSKSILAMADFINIINPHEKTKLLVTDINQEAFDLICEHPIKLPRKTSLKMFRGDLTGLGLKNESIDYVRMDFTQNFITHENQPKLLGELKRILSTKGMISSLLDMTTPDVNESFIDTRCYDYFGYNLFVPSEEMINDLAKNLELNVSYYGNKYFGFIFEKHRENFVVFEKK